MPNNINIYDLMNKNLSNAQGDTIDSGNSMNYKTTLRKEVISVLRGQAMLGLLGGNVDYTKQGFQGLA